jgi:hypothetical protein
LIVAVDPPKVYFKVCVKLSDFLLVVMVTLLPILTEDADAVGADTLGIAVIEAVPDNDPDESEEEPVVVKDAAIESLNEPSSLCNALPVHVAKVHTALFRVSMCDTVGVLLAPPTLSVTEGFVSRL